jgi:hypothetical protein
MEDVNWYIIDFSLNNSEEFNFKFQSNDKKFISLKLNQEQGRELCYILKKTIDEIDSQKL